MTEHEYICEDYGYQCPTCSKYTKCGLHPSVTGHICHSQAREYLNREVIKELERLKAMVENVPRNLKEENYCRGRNFGIDIAIKLLKEGVT
jgi:hypothetical protein